ncbi:hypothetical protein A6U92_23300 [Agrobacterium rubi]|nr:hypothetical protein A6U92_23300 [Agrobacterium rubi]
MLIADLNAVLHHSGSVNIVCHGWIMTECAVVLVKNMQAANGGTYEEHGKRSWVGSAESRSDAGPSLARLPTLSPIWPQIVPPPSIWLRVRR